MTGQIGTLGSERRASDRRSAGAALTWPERRTGFDRRRRTFATGVLRDNSEALVVLVVVLNALNILDLALTAEVLSLGAAEANPIMAAAFAHGWETAALVKVGSMALISLAVLLMRRYRRVLQVALAGAALYAVLICYHLVGASILL